MGEGRISRRNELLNKSKVRNNYKIPKGMRKEGGKEGWRGGGREGGREGGKERGF